MPARSISCRRSFACSLEASRRRYFTTSPPSLQNRVACASGRSMTAQASYGQWPSGIVSSVLRSILRAARFALATPIAMHLNQLAPLFVVAFSSI